eukprot:m.211099 g.211099  ORF g.211099 m.211099 type:complete len:57 (+) comp26137_c0_seq8:184-354(+)
MLDTAGSGHYKYGEFEYVCNTSAILAKNCFPHPDFYELFDLEKGWCFCSFVHLCSL